MENNNEPFYGIEYQRKERIRKEVKQVLAEDGTYYSTNGSNWTQLEKTRGTQSESHKGN